MMVKRELLSSENKELAKGIVKKGFAAQYNRVEVLEFNSYIHSKEASQLAKYVPYLIDFEFIEPLADLPVEDKQSAIFLSVGERQELLEDVKLEKLLGERSEKFHKYIAENSFESKMNSEHGSIQIRFTVNPEHVRELGFNWSVDSFDAVSTFVNTYCLPYWLNAIKFNQYIVNEESLPGITVQEVFHDLIEIGMNYTKRDSDDVLFKKEMEYVLIDEVDRHQSNISKDWEKGGLVIDALKKDHILKLSVLLPEEKDLRMDFPMMNSLISMAYRFGAFDCLDYLMHREASLLRTPGGGVSALTAEAYSSVFSGLLNVIDKSQFAWYKFFFEYMKKEVVRARERGQEIPHLKEKVDLIIFKMLVSIDSVDRTFLCEFLIDFAYSVLPEDDASTCIVENFFAIDEVLPDYRHALRIAPLENIQQLLLKNYLNVYFVYQVVRYKSINPELIVWEGKNIQELINNKFGTTNEIVRQINTFWRK